METAVAIDINASATTIMALLTDADNFTRWNTTITSIEGEIKKGETIKVKSSLDPKRIFKLEVSKVTDTEMVWESGMGAMFSGVRTYTLTAKGGGVTEFSMVEIFKGMMLPMIKSSLPDFKESFEQFAADLKRAAESK